MSDSERELRAVFESAVDAILIADDSGRYIDANPAACALLGLCRQDLLGRSIADFMAPGFDFGESWSTFLAQGRLSGEIRLVRPDGLPVDVEFNAISHVTPGRHLSILRDVSERKRTEAALRRSKQELNDFFENASIGLHWAAPDGRILRVNQAELDMLGYERQEYLGHPWAEFHADPEVAEDIFERLRQGETLHNYRARLCHKDGSVRHVLISSNTYREDGEFVHTRSFTRDISDLARAEEGLQLLAAAGQLFAESLDYEVTLQNVAQMAVPAFAEWCVIDLVGEDGRLQRLVTVHGDPALQPLIEELKRYPSLWEEDHGTARVLRTGRSFLLPELRPEQVERFVRDADHRRILEALDPHSVLSVPLTARGRRLGAWGFFRTKAGPLYQERELRLAETLARRAALAIDNARLYSEAESASRSKDQFLASLSHELRTPLTPVLMRVAKLESDGRLDEDLRRDVAVIRKNIQLEARLIDDLLDLTRIARGKVELQREIVDVHALLEHAVQICSTEAVQAGQLTVETDLRAPDARVWADGSRLTQVFWNLLSNAVKFTPQGGTVRVRTWTEGPAIAEERIGIEVSDTGIGIEPEALPRIFGAFEQGRLGKPAAIGGLGLGLAISKAILELHGGSLSAASAGRGHGATFTAWIPRRPESFADAPPAEQEPSERAPQPDSGGHPLRILLVEDHPDTAEALAELLRTKGYSVVVVDSLAAARQTVAGWDGRPGIDLVLSDLGLPDGSGHELMAELSSRYGVRGIALSGYGMEEDVRKSREAGFALHLTKPVSPQTLEEAIRKVAAG